MPKTTKTTSPTVQHTVSSPLQTLRTFSKMKLLAVVALLAVVGIGYVVATHAAVNDGSIPLYRLHSANIHTYVYTTDGAGYQALQNYGYAPEGAVMNVWPTASLDGRIPIYQVTDNPNGGGHLVYSTETEKNFLVGLGASNDGIKFYVYPGAGAGRTPVYRVLNKTTNERILTAKTAERDTYLSNGWTDEGIKFYSSDQNAVANVFKPEGNVDTNTCTAIAGWAIDKDSPTTSIQVHIYIDGKLVTGIGTGVSRPDINSTYKVTGNHGFNWAVPALYRDGKAHTVEVYAININSAGAITGDNALIGKNGWACSTKVASNPTPFNGNPSPAPGAPPAPVVVTQIPVGSCLTVSASGVVTQGTCLKGEADAQNAFFKGVATAADCVAIDGRTMVRCTQDMHNQQVASGALIERGCIGQTLDGTNRIDCSVISRDEQNAFFRGVVAAQEAAAKRDTGTSSPIPAGDPSPVVVDLRFLNGYATCTLWYYNEKHDPQFAPVNKGSFVTSTACRDNYFSAPSPLYGKGLNHIDWSNFEIWPTFRVK
jgi:hypothetical protein